LYLYYTYKIFICQVLFCYKKAKKKAPEKGAFLILIPMATTQGFF